MKNLLAVLLVGIAAYGGYYYAKENNLLDAKKSYSGPILATIDNQPIYDQEVKERYYGVQRGLNVKYEDLAVAAKENIVKEIVAERKLAKAAKDAGVHKQQSYKDKLEKVSHKILKEEYLKVKSKELVTEALVQKRYNDLSNALVGKKQIKVRHILLGSEKEAKRLYRDLKSKKSDEAFTKAAKEKSIDKKTGVNGGNLGYLIEGTMLKEFEEAALDLEIGELSKPIKTPSGWHIVKVDEKKDAEALPYNQVKGQIANELRGAVVQDYIRSLVADVKIQIIDGNKPVEKPAPVN